MGGNAGRHSSAVAGLKPREVDWMVWKKAYDEATTIDDRISLLHTWPLKFGHITFFLTEAEGYRADENYFFSVEDLQRVDRGCETLFGYRSSIASARREIAKTAFSRLVTQLFKDTGESKPIQSWVSAIADKEVLETLIEFFRIDENHRFVNWPDPFSQQVQYQIKIVQEFLETLCRYGWRPDACMREWQQDFFREHRLKFVPILCGLGKLDILLNFDTAEEELEIVKKLALEREYFFPKISRRLKETHRRPKNIEEAAYAGSQAGRIAILLSEKLKMQKHFEALEDAYKRRSLAERDLQNLSTPSET